jgi:hypothetical protein
MDKSEDGSLPWHTFKQFDYTSICYSEPQFRKLLIGNGVNQKGLIQYFELGKFTKEILWLLADFSDLLKNPNYEVFK